MLCLHSKKQEKESSVSVVADLRQASLQTTRFIAETLLLLEVCLPFSDSVPELLLLCQVSPEWCKKIDSHFPNTFKNKVV